MVVNKDEYKNIDFEIETVCIDSKDSDKTEEDIKKINGDLRISNLDAQVREESGTFKVLCI